jgi:hypothetical protein
MLMNPIHVIKRCHKKIIEYKKQDWRGIMQDRKTVI